MNIRRAALIALIAWALPAPHALAAESAFPGQHWETRTPKSVGLSAPVLDRIRDYMQGRGCITRHGYLVYTWGDCTQRGDVASALKPWIAHFLFKAVEEGRIPSLDTKVAPYAPCLKQINANLGYKDRNIRFRHMANQTSCYGVREEPGTAFDYNDWQMALFFDTLFLNVYGATQETVDAAVLHPRLTDPIQCEDNPTFLAFGPGDRAGRLAVSPRDFCRFGLLYLHEGQWKGRATGRARLLSSRHARMAVTSPLPNSIPRTQAEPAEMCPGQRTLGSQRIPDSQCDHNGSYSWLWWINGVGRDGRRYWPDAPTDVFAALGHANGMRGMAVIPSLDIVLSWNDTALGDMPEKPHPLNRAFQWLREATAP